MNLCKQQGDCVLATTVPIAAAAMCEHILSKRSSMHTITMQSLLAVGEACCSGWMRLNINQFWMWSQSCVVANPHINWGMSKQVSNSLMFAIGLQSPYRCMWRWFMNRLLPARSQTCINEWDLECRCLIANTFKRLRIVLFTDSIPLDSSFTTIKGSIFFGGRVHFLYIRQKSNSAWLRPLKLFLPTFLSDTPKVGSPKVASKTSKGVPPLQLRLFVFLTGDFCFTKNMTRWWQLKYVLCSPRKLGKVNPIWRAYFSDGLVETTN